MESGKVTTSTAAAALRRPSAFIDSAAVEAWDAWFRWRENGVLRDLTIEDTWARIVATLAAAESAAQAGSFGKRLGEALATWRLLLDERIVAGAGTGRAEWPPDGLAATLNLAAFVRAPFTSAAQFDRAQFVDAVELAVRALDEAATLAGATTRETIRVGIAGLADALALLGIAYDSESGREFARGVVRTQAEACLRASNDLARERGAGPANPQAAVARAEALAVSPELLASIRQHGLRFARHTAISAQPRLALLANHIADALDPLPPDELVWIDAPLGGRRAIRSAGFAATLRKRIDWAAPLERDDVGVAGRDAMRLALAPWIDVPIDYP